MRAFLPFTCDFAATVPQPIEAKLEKRGQKYIVSAKLGADAKEWIPMLNLMLLRHAKSSWADAGQADRDRPLNDRGKRAAVAMGRYMASNGLVPQLVLCSPARRAKETWGLVAGELKAFPAILTVPEIYDFGDGQALMECLRSKAGAAQSVLLVGHNPAIAGLAKSLVGKGSDKLRERLEKKYPTAALAVISFDLDNWEPLAAGAGTLLRFIRPGDILDDNND